MKRIFTRMVLGVALLAGGVLPALAQGKMVTLADVTQGDAAASIWVSGTVASRQQAALSAEVSGRVEWIAEFGSRVSKGDELLRLDSAALRLSLEQAQAEQDHGRLEAHRGERIGLFLRQAAAQVRHGVGAAQLVSQRLHESRQGEHEGPGLSGRQVGQGHGLARQRAGVVEHRAPELAALPEPVVGAVGSEHEEEDCLVLTVRILNRSQTSMD